MSWNRNLLVCALAALFALGFAAGASAQESGTTACTNGSDDDGDGLVDADDSSCHEALCQDGLDNDGDGVADGSDTDCQCVSDVKGWDPNGPDPHSNACTAEDVDITLIAHLPPAEDGCINSDDTVSAEVEAELNAKSTTRYDIGMWVALQGTTALHNQNGTGLCGRQILRPPAGAPTYLPSDDCTGDPTNPGPLCSVLTPDGPYRMEEAGGSNSPRDRCGDIRVEDWNKPSVTRPDAVFEFVVPPANDNNTPTPMRYTFPCRDVTLSGAGNGMITLGTCTSWDQNADSVCSNFAQAVPGTTSKCRCEDTESDIPGPNARMGCALGTPPGGVLDEGEPMTNSVSITNTLPTPNTCTATDSALSCGTVAYLRIVIEYPVTYGSITGWTETAAYAGNVQNDTTNGRLVWTPRNHVGAPGSLGILGPSPTTTPALSYTFQRNTTNLPTGTQLTFATKIFWSATLDSTPLTDLLNLTGAREQTCTDCGCSNNVTTTPVTLTGFDVERDGRFVTVDWTTATEVGNVGFNVLGKTADGWVTLNDEPIPAGGGDALLPQRYSEQLYAPEEVTEFAIEDVDVKGVSTRHAAGRPMDEGGRPPEIEALPSEVIRAEHEALEAERESERRHTVRESLRSGVGSGLRVGATAAPSAQAIDLKVAKDGLYRVTYEDLRAAGFDLATVPAAKLGLTSRGADVPVYLSAGKTFGPGSYFDFYGRALDTLYTTTNVYRLDLNAKKPALASVDAAAPAGAAVPSYVETRTFERNTDYSFLSPTGDPWFDTRMLTYTTPREWSFPFTVDGLASGAPAVLSVHLFGGTDPAPDPDHHVVLLVNGVEVASSVANGFADLPLTAPLPAGALAEGANTLAVRLPADLGAPFDIVHLEDFSVSYPRSFNAAGGALTFTASGGRFEVAGLPDSSVAAYRIGTGSLTRLTGAVVTGSPGSYTASLPGSGGGATYAVASAAAMLKPTITAARAAASITSGSAQYLIISHPSFIAGLSPLVSARQAQGLRVKIVDVEDVYAQYSHGIFDPNAIRSYIAYAARAMGAEFVLLVGGDTYDYKDYLGLHSTSFIPSLYGATGDIVRFAPLDPAYADLDGDGKPDLAIGRLPVRTRAELDNLVGKILAYQNKSYSGTAVFAADRSDPASNVPFPAASDKLAGKLGAGWWVERVYLDATPLASARGNLIANINGGTALTNYVGHSGPTTWSFSGLFTVADAGALTNYGRPTVVTQWGCWNTYYVNPRSETLGTKLLLAGDRGAAAVLGATTLTEDDNENALGGALAGLIAQPGMTLGKAILAAKQGLPGPPAALVDVLLGWSLLGDPALVVQP